MRRLTTLAAAVVLALSASWASAQDYPTKPITLIVPFPAGGATDQLMRALGDAASKHLGQPVIVDNRAGGGGAIGPGHHGRSRRSRTATPSLRFRSRFIGCR